MMDLKQIKALDQLLKKLRAQSAQAEAEAHTKMKSAPRVPKELRERIEGMLNKIRSYNDYTFEYEAAVEKARNECREKGIPIPGNIWVNPGAYGVAQYEHANREALNLKKDITRLLTEYKTFYQKFPDFATWSSYGVQKEFRYQNVDPYVLKTEALLKELRCFGEQEVYELKKTGANMAYLLGASDRELNG